MLENQIPAALTPEWTIPTTNPGAPIYVPLEPGRATVVVGANGSGKSALAVHLEAALRGQSVEAIRIAAHRRIWMESSSPDILPSRRDDTEAVMVKEAFRDDVRWRDRTEARAKLALYDLMSRTALAHAEISDIARGRGPEGVTVDQVPPTPLEKLNELYRLAFPGVELKVDNRGGLEVHLADGQPAFPISQMSDGEKNALLLIAEVLTSPTSVFVVDEPERHMHRSISAPLLLALMEARRDCHFAFFTHDLDLASRLRFCSLSLVVESCSWQGSTPTSWTVHVLNDSTQIPEEVRLDVLGGRTRILFVEGRESSLDRSLYGLLYPDWQVSPVGGCTEVVRAVKGLRDTHDHHWVTAHGMVDRDRRSDEAVAALEASAVTVLALSEVENLYYSKMVIHALAERQAVSLGLEFERLAESAVTAAIDSLSDEAVQEYLSSVVSEAAVRSAALSNLPGANSLRDGKSIRLELDNPFNAEKSRLSSLVQNGDLEQVLRDFPIRNSKMRNAVAAALRFQSSSDYEAAARTWLVSDSAAADKMRDLVGWNPNTAAI